jgi:thiol-disulfide isomerase/thioredoxin
MLPRKLLTVSVIGALTTLQFFTTNLALGQNASFGQAQKEYASGNYAKALQYFSSFAQVYPTNALTHYYMAMCHQQMGHSIQAKQEYGLTNQYGDANLKAMSTKALQALSGGSGSGSSSSTGSVVAAAGSTAGASRSGGKVAKILKFYADWCGPCKRFAPIFEATKPQFRDIRFEELNVDEPSNQALSQQYGITGIPAIVYLDRSGNLIEKGGAFHDAASFAAHIQELSH